MNPSFSLSCNAEPLHTVTVYNKLFTKILDSSIWLESDSTRIVWLTLLAAMDEDGHAQFASVANLAHRAIVPLSEAEEAVKKLESPDSNSSDPDNEGRRIERVQGGWIVLNAHKYREIVTRAISQERTRARVARFRARGKSVTDSNGDVTPANVHVTTSEALAETESVSDTPLAGKRARNEILDALVAVDGSNPLQVTSSAFASAAKALKEIRGVMPEVTASEIARRATNYRTLHPDWTITPLALSKHWAVCEKAPTPKGSIQNAPIKPMMR